MNEFGPDDVIKTVKMQYLEFGKDLISSWPLIRSEINCRIFWSYDKLILVKQKVYYPYDDVIVDPNDVTNLKLDLFWV